MLSGIRNTTPGPSALGRNVNAGGSHGARLGRSNGVKKREDRDREVLNALKRPSSEEVLDDDERERKKARVVDDDATNAKDNKEKRRKRRKKRKKPVSVVVASSSDTSQQEAMGLALHASSETLVSGQASSRSSADIVNGVKVETDADDELPAYSSSDKGKGRAKPDSPKSLPQEHPNLDNRDLGSGSTPGSDTRSTTLEGPNQSSEIASLKEQLAQQDKLLEKHQSYLTQHQQALTCQICLELLHRPYALIPCGHVTCYGCLVRWFTSDLNAEESAYDEEQQQANESDQPNGDDLNAILNSAAASRGTFVRRRKTCPVCRGVVPDRPVEMWDIKQMVAALAKSQLVDLPVLPSEVGEESSTAHGNTPNDPWRNVFRPGRVGRGHHRNGGPPPPGQADDEEERVRFGWYDHEDGGVYRCIDCHHELWGGMCTGCERIYLGHEPEEDDSDEDVFSQDGDGDPGALQWAGYMYLHDDWRRQLVSEDEDEEDEDDDEVGDYNVGVWGVDDAVQGVDEEEEEDTWAVSGGADAEGVGDIDVESSDGFIDEEERMRSGGLSGVGQEEESDSDVGNWTSGRTLHTAYLLETEGEDDGSEEEAGSEPIRGRNLRVRNRLEEDEGTSLDEGSDDRLGWGGDISGDDSDQETLAPVQAPGLRRITRRRTLAAQSVDGSSSGESPPRRRSSRLRWDFRRRVLGSDSEDGGDSGEGELTWVEYYQQ